MDESSPSLRLPLADLQRDMMAAIYRNRSPELLAAIVPREGLECAALVDIYRHATRATLVHALRISYPVIERLVGAEFFCYAASSYVDAEPSRHGDLECFGMTFGDFLAAWSPARELVYLLDVARLECLIGELQRAPTPQSRIFESIYPVVRIWQQNHDLLREPDPISLDDGADRVIVQFSGVLRFVKIPADPTGFPH